MNKNTYTGSTVGKHFVSIPGKNVDEKKVEVKKQIRIGVDEFVDLKFKLSSLEEEINRLSLEKKKINHKIKEERMLRNEEKKEKEKEEKKEKMLKKEEKKQKEKEEEKKPENHGKEWTEKEKNEVFDKYNKGVSIYTLCDEYKRTKFSIKLLLSNINKIKNSNYDCVYLSKKLPTQKEEDEDEDEDE